MEISITGRNLELDDSLKKYIHKRFSKFRRLYSRIYRGEIILEEEKERKNAEIILHLKRNRIIARESSPDMYVAIDSAVENVKKQLRRLHDRLRSRRKKGR